MSRDGAPAEAGSGPLVLAFHAAQRRTAPQFTIPGHKGRSGELEPELSGPLAADVPLHGGLDTVPRQRRGRDLRLSVCWDHRSRRWAPGRSRFLLHGHLPVEARAYGRLHRQLASPPHWR